MTTPHKLSKEELVEINTLYDIDGQIHPLDAEKLLSHIAAQQDDYSTAGNGIAILQEEITKLTIERDQLKQRLESAEAVVNKLYEQLKGL